MLDYRIQQLSKGSNEGYGIIPEVPDESKDNSSSSSSSLSGSDNEIQSTVDVPIHQEDPAVQRTPLVDNVILMVTEKTVSTPTPLTTQAQVTNVSEFVSSLNFDQRLSEL
ncbi:hypothetical protein Tco_0696812 [Tanacetum coccineum]